MQLETRLIHVSPEKQNMFNVFRYLWSLHLLNRWIFVLALRLLLTVQLVEVRHLIYFFWHLVNRLNVISRFFSPFRPTWGRQSQTWRSEAGPASALTSPSTQTSPSQFPETVPAITVGCFWITIIIKIIQWTSISLSVIRSCPYAALDICMSWLWDEERSNLQNQKLVKKLRKTYLVNESPQTLLKDRPAIEKKAFWEWRRQNIDSKMGTFTTYVMDWGRHKTTHHGKFGDLFSINPHRLSLFWLYCSVDHPCHLVAWRVMWEAGRQSVSQRGGLAVPLIETCRWGYVG